MTAARWRSFVDVLRPDPRRDASVETLRGLACLLLVMYHVRGGDPASGLRLAPDQPWAYFVDSLVYLRMPLFSFLSGVVYARRPLRSGYPGFVRGKVRRLLVPLLVVGTVFAVVQVLTGAAEGLPPWYLWHVVPVAHFWFLESVFWVLLLVALLDRFGLLEKSPIVVMAIAAGVLAQSVVRVPENALGLQTAVFLLPFVLTGVLVQRFDWRAAPTALRTITVVVALLLLVRTQLGLAGVLSVVPAEGSLLGGVLGVVACLSLTTVRWNVRFLVTIGAFSFTIYTCHVFATSGARMVLHRFGIESISANMVLGTLAGLAFGIAVELAARRSAWASALVLGARWPGSDASSLPRRGRLDLPDQRSRTGARSASDTAP